MTVVAFDDLWTCDLHIDGIYRGGRQGNAGDDPLGRLLRVSNSGGFRYRGNVDGLEVLALTTTMSDPDWPDSMDRETGVFTYFGDNKKPGRELHDTPRRGNAVLARIFDDAHSDAAQRARVPPIFLFASTGEWRDVEFLGLAVPGTRDLRATEDLVAIWKVAQGRRFQNYRARLSVLKCRSISRDWLNAVIDGDKALDLAPPAWREWVLTGRMKVLECARSLEHRTRAEQLPTSENDRAMIVAIHEHFEGRPHAFEHCAAAIAKLMLPTHAGIEVTRPSRDGGRDALGKLRIGSGAGAILVDFALEAKCYGLANSVGVRELSRLISRLRHRQFGVLVTTSFVDLQAYREIKDDQHPIIIISAVDIVELLRANGRGGRDEVKAWLSAEFPPEV